ncbi:MAG: hypothetical protein JST66_12580 [Bacteroidetes bacterium]|nr:hypothetical protein [Bacteroidota bacterium]
MVLPEFNNQGLLPTGIHPVNIPLLHERFVAPFGMSNREALWQGLLRYQAALLELGIHAMQWVNGSFVDATRHIPDDIDLVNFCTERMLERVKVSDLERVADLLDGSGGARSTFGCHCGLVVVYPKHDPRFHELTKPKLAYWLELFSKARDYSQEGKPAAPHRGAKGFVQLSVGDPKLCPDVRQLF